MFSRQEKGLLPLCERLGLTTHAETSCAKCMDTVGVRLDVGATWLQHKPLRVWRFHLETLHLLRRPCMEYDWLAIWLGHACCLSWPPSTLSVCQEIETFYCKTARTVGEFPSATWRREFLGCRRPRRCVWSGCLLRRLVDFRLASHHNACRGC